MFYMNKIIKNSKKQGPTKSVYPSFFGFYVSKPN